MVAAGIEADLADVLTTQNVRHAAAFVNDIKVLAVTANKEQFENKEWYKELQRERYGKQVERSKGKCLIATKYCITWSPSPFQSENPTIYLRSSYLTYTKIQFFIQPHLSVIFFQGSPKWLSSILKPVMRQVFTK